MSSSAGGERPDVLAHILRTTARLTLTPAKLAAVLAGAFRALPLLNTSSRAMQSTRSKFVQSCRFHARVPCLINLEVPYPFTPANTPLGHCPSPLEQWPHQLANRVRPSSRSTANPADLPSPSGAAAQRDPRCAQIAGSPTARQPYVRLARASSASKNPLYLGPTRRRCEASRIGDRGADFSAEVPSLVNHESALPLYTGQYSPWPLPISPGAVATPTGQP